jgi:hypothetical protein
MGVPAGGIIYICLIIYVLMAREKVRFEEGVFQTTKDHLSRWISKNYLLLNQ